MTALAITLGEGLSKPRGRRFPLPPPPVDGTLSALAQLPPVVEGWWSPFTWREDLRRADAWESAAGIAIDVDYDDKHADPPPELADGLTQWARSGKFPGSLFHLTPHGARVVFVFDQLCTDRDAYVRAARAAGQLVSDAISGVGYHVDAPLLGDLARLFFTPNAIAKGVARQAELILMRREPYTLAELLALSAPAETPAPAPAGTGERPRTFQQAIAAFNADHSLDAPRAGGTCPVCGHNDCFGRMPDDDTRWVCFSTDHPRSVGIPGTRGTPHMHGDALDLEMHRTGKTRVEVLRAGGYLPKRGPYEVARGEPIEEPTEAGAPVVPIDAGRRPYSNNSYFTAVQIIERNHKNVLGGKKLEWNEMTGRPTLDRRPLEDVDETRVRAEIERRFGGGEDGRGLRLSIGDVRHAMQQVARERPFHPVREYLAALKWDGVERIDAAVEDVLGAPRSVLNMAMLRRFMVSAVARALTPGCKVDTVLVFVGKQGCGKSSFFRCLAGEWFVDTAVDIHDKDSFQMLRRSWIYEWAELEVLRRAKDAAAAKAFLSSQIDTYRPPYGHNPIDVPRSCVIVGSTNNDEFLTDDTGNRRFWPLRVGQVNLDLLIAQRDQLWAEAVALHARGEAWWLTAEESAALAMAHEDHEVSDAWEEFILNWSPVEDFTTGDVLRQVIKKDMERWSKGDEHRVAAILRRNGWAQVKVRGRRIWRRK